MAKPVTQFSEEKTEQRKGEFAGNTASSRHVKQIASKSEKLYVIENYFISLECVNTLPVPQDRMRSCKCTALSNQQTVSPETPDVHVQMTMTIMGISFIGTKRARLMSHVSMEGGAMLNIKNT